MGYAAVKWRILPVATTQKANHDFLAKIVQIIPASHISSNLNIWLILLHIAVRKNILYYQKTLPFSLPDKEKYFFTNSVRTLS